MKLPIRYVPIGVEYRRFQREITESGTFSGKRKTRKQYKLSKKRFKIL